MEEAKARNTDQHTGGGVMNIAYQMFETGNVPIDAMRDMFEANGFPEPEALYDWLRDATADLGIQELRLTGTEQPYAVGGNYWWAELDDGELYYLRVTNRAGQMLIWRRARGWEVKEG